MMTAEKFAPLLVIGVSLLELMGANSSNSPSVTTDKAVSSIYRDCVGILHLLMEISTQIYILGVFLMKSPTRCSI